MAARYAGEGSTRRMGWSHIDCIEVDDDEVQAELWEIAENLHRLDLTKDERDRHIRRYAELLEVRRTAEKPGQNVQVSNAGGRGNKSVSTVIAEETGLSARTVRRALNPPPPIPIKSALEPESEEEAIIREANAIVAAWNRARQAARELALSQIDAPLMDQRYG